MKLNMQEIEQRHERTKLIRAAFGGVISQGIADVDWLIAEVKRLRARESQTPMRTGLLQGNINEGGRG